MRYQFGVSQRVPWPGKLLAASDVSLERADAERARFDGAQLRLVADVSMAYAALHYLGRNLQVTRDTLALLQHWESVAQGQLQAGRRGAQRDVIRAQVELGRLEDQVQSLENARLPLRAKLNGLLNQPPGARLPTPTTLPEPELRVSDAEVMELARRESPALRALDHETGARQRGVDLANQSYLPDFSVGAMISGVSSSRFGRGVPNSGDDPIAATLGIELPIWFGRYGASVSEAKARLQAAESDRRSAENDLMADIATALFTFRDAERKVRLYRDSLLAKARQALEATAAAYEAGQGSFLDVLDSERKLIEFELAHERARADRVAAMSRLEALVGSQLQNLEDVR
jgi:outer membrane protein TolC